MYIKKVEITNIRSIDKFEMVFDNPAGWHVLIGDNGSGKTTILRAIALALIGPERAPNLRENWKNWLRENESAGEIKIKISPDIEYENTAFPNPNNLEPNKMPRYIDNDIIIEFDKKINEINIKPITHALDGNSPYQYNWLQDSVWFSAGFGSLRRFTGSASEWDDKFANPQLQAIIHHLTLFDEAADLQVTLAWLIKLQFQKLEAKNDYIDKIISLINSPGFFPDKTQLKEVSSEGIIFANNDGKEISISQLSDGFKSILCITIELLRLLVESYSPALHYKGHYIFTTSNIGEIFINVPGVVLIDEIDAHLHPTWQTRIGQWFTKYFPNIQFIVTTHSPLVCRACEKGSIWRLAAPGSEAESGEIMGTDRDRLIYGNVLDAYGTEVFGEDVSQSANGEKMVKELGDLNLKSFKGTISESDKKRMQELKKILPTE